MVFRHAAVVGVDASTSYFETFKAMKKTNPVFETNFAFYYLMKLIYIITGGNYHIYTILISGFVILSYYYLAKKYATNALVTVFWFLGMGYYTFLFSALKQAMAMEKMSVVTVLMILCQIITIMAMERFVKALVM